MSKTVSYFKNGYDVIECHYEMSTTIIIENADEKPVAEYTDFMGSDIDAWVRNEKRRRQKIHPGNYKKFITMALDLLAVQKVNQMNPEQLKKALSDPDPMTRAAASWRYYPQYSAR